MVSMATGTAWLLRSGTDSVPGAAVACAAAPLAALIASWLAGRGSRRLRPEAEGEA